MYNAAVSDFDAAQADYIIMSLVVRRSAINSRLSLGLSEAPVCPLVLEGPAILA